MSGEDDSRNSVSRRAYLKSTSGAVVGSTLIAGCLGGDDPDDDTTGDDTDQDTPSGDGDNGDPEETIVLTEADPLPETHLMRQGIEHWMDQVTELTDGRVEFEKYPGGELGEANEMLELLRAKTADVTYLQTTYIGEIPLTGVMEVPGAQWSTSEGMEAFWSLIRGGILEDEFREIDALPVSLVIFPPYQIWTDDSVGPVETMDDLSGLDLRSAGGLQSVIIDAIGANPVETTAYEIYTNWERGVIEGGVYSEPTVLPFDLQEVSSHGTTNLNLGVLSIMFCVHVDTWADFPDDIQEAMNEASTASISYMGEEIENEVQDVRDILESEHDFTLYEVPDDTVAEINERLGGVRDDWIADLEERGHAAGEVWDEWERALEEVQ